MKFLVLILMVSLSFFGRCSSLEQARSPEDQRPTSAQTANVPLNARPEEAYLPNEHESRDIQSVPCEEYVLQKIAKERTNDRGGQTAKTKTLDTTDQTLSPDLRGWIGKVSESDLVSFELQNKEKKVMVLSSVYPGATGVASNLHAWYVLSDNYSVQFLSMSQNPDLIFWDKDGFLNYYIIEYSAEFLNEKDWKNLRLDLLRYRISDNGDAKIVSSERNRKCD